MADEIRGVPIGDLPGIESVPDDSMLVVEFLGKAYSMPGVVLKQLFQDILDAMGSSVDDVTEARLTAAIETVLASGKYNGISPIVEVLDAEGGTAVIHVVDATGIHDYPVEVKGAQNAVQYIKQTLTAAQQKQARENIGVSSGDWAVNDPNAAGYVQNRTHWKELTGWAGELVPETTIEFKGTTNAITLGNVDEHGVEKGKPYTVTWNGVDYDCIGKDSGDGMYIGNGKLMDAYGLMGLPDTGEPFCLHALTEEIHTLYKRDKTAETITITVTARREAIYHPMEEGYIPETLRASVSYKPQELSEYAKVQARKNIESSVVVELSGYPIYGYHARIDGKEITGNQLDRMAEAGTIVIGIASSLSFTLPDGLTRNEVASGTVFRYENAVASRNPENLEGVSTHWYEFHAQINGVDYGIRYDSSGEWKGYAISSVLTFMLTEADGQPKLSWNGQIMPNWAVIELLNMASYSNRPVFCFQKNMRFFKADGSVFIPAMYTPFSLMLSGTGEHIFFCEQDGYKYNVTVEENTTRSTGAAPTAEKTVAYKTAESKADNVEVEDGELFLLSAGERISEGVTLPANSGQDGLTPHIGENGNWWIGETDTGVAATAGAEAAEAAAAAAQASAGEASTAALRAGTYAENAQDAESNASNYATQARSHMNYAEGYAGNAASSKTAAASSATTATNAANEAKGYRDEVKNMLDNAEVDPANAVLVIKQTLTEEQKAQARENIGALSIEDLVSDYKTIGKNKLNLNALTVGKYLWPDGSMTDNSARYVTDYIAVEQGDIVTSSLSDSGTATLYEYNAICLYDTNKNVVSGGDYNKALFVVPAGVAFVRLTISGPLATASYNPQIELTADGVPTSYEPYTETTRKALDDKISILESAIVKAVFVAIPKAIHIVVGKEFRMYYKNVMSRYTDRLWLGYTSGITVKRYTEYLSITATEAMTKSVNWKVYDDAFNVLDSGTMTVIATDDIAKTSKVLVIGDSTVTQSNAISQKLLDCYAASNGNLTLLGTRGSSPALHEGRAGWTSTMYCTVASNGGVPNPFYNNGFDFSYYMAQQGYSGVDIVVIQLGINDIFSMTYENFKASTTLSNLDAMINSILAYNINIKIIVDLISPPNGNGTSFTDTYNTTQIDFVFLTNTIRLSDALIEHFEGKASVTISPNNCVLDTKTDINDGVHPNVSGYAKLGQAIYETINGIYVPGEEEPEEPEDNGELWNMASRTAQVVSGNTAATATRTIDGSKYYYPAAYTGGWVGNAATSLSDVVVDGSTVQFASSASAYGIFVPFLGLDSTKKYRFTVNPTVAGFRVYLMNYDASGVYVNNAIIVDKTTGLKTYDFTPTAGYQQGFCFACLSGTKNILGTFTDLSLKVVE